MEINVSRLHSLILSLLVRATVSAEMRALAARVWLVNPLAAMSRFKMCIRDSSKSKRVIDKR